MIIKGKHLKVIPEEHNLFKLSVSKAKTFKTCKRKYKFNYIDKLPKKEWEFQVFGKFLHQVLENFENHILDAGNEIPDNVIMKKSFDDALNMSADDYKDPEEEEIELYKQKLTKEQKIELYKQKLTKEQKIELYKQKLTKEQKIESFEILKTFLIKRNELKQSGELPTVLWVEKPFNIEVDGKLLINGFIDVVQRDPDGVLHVADYKTSKSKRYLQNDFMQLKAYAYAMCLEDPDLKFLRCSYVMLRHDFDSIVTEFTRDEVMEMEKEFEEYYQVMQEEKLFRASPSGLCKFCDFIHKCPEGMRKFGVADSSFGETSW